MGVPVLSVAVAVLVGVCSAPASAADCVSGTTNWKNPEGGNWKNAANWSNGVPTANCDARITLAGDYGVALPPSNVAPAQAHSVKIGGASGGQTLVADNHTCYPANCGWEFQLVVGSGGMDVNGHGTIKMIQGTIAVESGAVVLDGGRLLGSGKFSAVYGGGLQNTEGRLVPTGALLVQGPYTAGPASTVRLDLDSAADLTVTGAVALDGTLEVRGSGAPDLVRIIIKTPGGRTGQFASLDFSGTTHPVTYAPNQVVLGTPSTQCTSGSTTWTEPNGGRWEDASNWSNGVPTATCDARIPDDLGFDIPYVTVDDGSARSLILGGASINASPYLVPQQLHIGAGGMTIDRLGHLELHGGSVDVAGTVTVNGGSIQGYGTVQASGGVVNTGGWLLPYNDNGADLNVTGDYTQGAGGELDVYLLQVSDQPNVSRLVVSGAAHLDGTLTVRGTFLARTTPERIVESDGRTGSFATVEYLNGDPYDLSYDDQGVVASARDISCHSGTTSWTNASGGRWGDAANWSNGRPTAACDAVITLSGDYSVSIGGSNGGQARSLTLGGSSGRQVLGVYSKSCRENCGYDSFLRVGAGGITVNTHGAVAFDRGDIDVAGSVELAGGELSGRGDLTTTGGLHNTSGKVAVYDSIEGSYRLRIHGDYSQGPGGTFKVFVPSPNTSDLGSMDVDGTAALDGTIELVGPAPAAAGPQRVLNATGGRTGTFATVSATDQPYDPQYASDGVDVVPRASSTCTSGTTTYVGGAQGDWSTPADWSNGVPSAACDVVVASSDENIQVSFAHYMVSGSGPAAHSLTVRQDGAGSVFFVNAGGTLRLSGDYTQTGPKTQLYISLRYGAGIPALAVGGTAHLGGMLGVDASPGSGPTRLIQAASRDGQFATFGQSADFSLDYDATGVTLVSKPEQPEDTTAPVLWSLSARPKTFTGTTRLDYKASEAAVVTVSVTGASKRRALANLTTLAKKGKNSYALDARCRTGGLCLKAGRYTVTLVATDAAGNLSKPISISVKVKRRSS